MMPLANKASASVLPPNPYRHNSDFWRAYDACLSLERQESWNVFVDEGISENIIFDLGPKVVARVLGWALLHAPSSEGRDALVREIVECDSDPELLAGLAHLYVYGLIRVFFNPKEPTPSVSASQSPRTSFENAIQDLEHLLEQSSTTAHDLRQLTLFRDEYRCVFTQAIDLEWARTRGPPVHDHASRYGPTRVAHIISQSISEDISGPSPAVRAKFEWAKTACAIMERFGGFSFRAILGDNVLHSPLNAFIATSAPHYLFAKLDIWLTPAKDEQQRVIPDTYMVERVDDGAQIPLALIGSGIKPRVTFKTATVGDKTIPPPHPRLIALHAACARIAHLSGAAEHLKEAFRDTDVISVMTEPNAGYELTRALKSLQLATSTT